MDQGQATEIKFFDVSSRIGRVRYLGYGWALGMALLPFTLAALYLLFHGSVLRGFVILMVLEIISAPIQFTFMIRRLHDMDRSGWWSLLSVPGMLSSAIKSLDFFVWHVHPNYFIHLPPSLASLGLFVMLLFAPGTEGSNRFGPQPPPNSAAVIAMAWSILAFPFIAIIAAIAYVSTLDFDKIKVTRAAEMARADVYPATRYFQENHRWPVDLDSVAGARTSGPDIGSVGTISYPDGGYGIVVRLKYDGSVEVWTTDNGENWHCGSPADAPLADKDLPDNCREEPPPTR